MTKVYTAFALLAAIIALGIAEYRAAAVTADEMLSVITLAEEAADEGIVELYSRCRETEQTWKKNKNTLLLFLPHGDLDQADLTADRLLRSCELGDRDEALLALSELRERVADIRDSERINIINLL